MTPCHDEFMLQNMMIFDSRKYDEDLMIDKNTKKQLPGVLRFLIKLFQIILYTLIQIIFIPVAIIGLSLIHI